VENQVVHRQYLLSSPSFRLEKSITLNFRQLKLNLHRMKVFKSSLFYISRILIFGFIATFSGSNALHQGMLNGTVLTVLSYQVAFNLLFTDFFPLYYSVLIHVNFEKLPPLSSYKKMTNGSYSFEGLFNEILDGMVEYFNARYHYKYN